MDSEKYAKFDVTETTYKVVNGQNIQAFVLTPKGLAPGKYPVVAKFHGGSFITGASLYPDWYPQWALDYCLLHSAIIVTGDYRLLPESTSLELYSDVLSFWDWVRSDLQPYLDSTRPGIEADLDKIIVHGESAGGTLAMLTGFSQPAGFIKAVIAMYPMITSNPKRTKPAFFGAPTIPPSVLQAHLDAMVPGQIITSAIPPARAPVFLSVAQQGLLAKYWGDDPRMNLMTALDTAGDMPYTVLLHGDEDSAVPVQGTLDWIEKAKGIFGDNSSERLDFWIQPGGEHGFDVAVPLETQWLQEKLQKVTELWLGDKA